MYSVVSGGWSSGYERQRVELCSPTLIRQIFSEHYLYARRRDLNEGFGFFYGGGLGFFSLEEEKGEQKEERCRERKSEE